MGDIEKWEYDQKKITADEAARFVKSGYRVFYGEFVLFPEAIDEELAKRANELHDVDVRSVCYMRVPKIVEADPRREHFILNDFHFGTISRRLYDQHLCNYIPMTYHQGPRVAKKYLDFDIVFFNGRPHGSTGLF
jgi:acyl-CoA hydrolase